MITTDPLDFLKMLRRTGGLNARSLSGPRSARCAMERAFERTDPRTRIGEGASGQATPPARAAALKISSPCHWRPGVDVGSRGYERLRRRRAASRGPGPRFGSRRSPSDTPIVGPTARRVERDMALDHRAAEPRRGLDESGAGGARDQRRLCDLEIRQVTSLEDDLDRHVYGSDAGADMVERRKLRVPAAAHPANIAITMSISHAPAATASPASRARLSGRPAPSGKPTTQIGRVCAPLRRAATRSTIPALTQTAAAHAMRGAGLVVNASISARVASALSRVRSSKALGSASGFQPGGGSMTPACASAARIG